MEGPTNKEKRILEKSYLFIDKTVPFLKWMFVIAIGVCFGNVVFWSFKEVCLNENKIEKADVLKDEQLPSSDLCNVVRINLRGTIYTYISENNDDTQNSLGLVSSENVVYYINQAEKDNEIKGIIIEVDSSGGLPVAGEEIANAIKLAKKPVVAYIRQIGVSSAYWAISSADRIYASKNSEVGGIGITGSYLNNVIKNQKEGLTYENLSVGKFKEMGNPDRGLTPEEKNLYMRDLNIMFKNFVNDVSINRNIPIEKVNSFADGSSVLGEKAKELGLIDDIGDMNSAKKYMDTQIGETSEMCW